MASLVQKQELIKTYTEQNEILKIKKLAYQAADDADDDDIDVMKLYDEYHSLKKVVNKMKAQIDEMNESGGGGGSSSSSGGGGGGGGAHWANNDKSELTEPVVVPPTPVVVPPTPVVVPPTPVVVVPPTPVVVPPTPVDVDPSKIHYVKSGADFREEYLKMIAAGKTCMVLGEGEYRVEKEYLEYGRFVLEKLTKIYGQGRGMTTLVGFGLKIEGNKSDGIVEIENLTIKGAEEDGLSSRYAIADALCDNGGRGMNVIMRGCTVEDCQGHGVFAAGVDISCDDLQVIGCGRSGVFASSSYKATITLSGKGTSIQGNVTKGNPNEYGLRTSSSSSTIHLVHPLTKEEISTNNGGGGNWGGNGTIDQVDNDGVVLQILYKVSHGIY